MVTGTYSNNYESYCHFLTIRGIPVFVDSVEKWNQEFNKYLSLCIYVLIIAGDSRFFLYPRKCNFFLKPRGFQWIHSIYLRFIHSHLQLRNLSWKPECVLSFNMDWWILVNFIPRFWLGIKYYSLMFSWQVEFWLAKRVLLKLQGSRAVTENQ